MISPREKERGEKPRLEVKEVVKEKTERETAKEESQEDSKGSGYWASLLNKENNGSSNYLKESHRTRDALTKIMKTEWAASMGINAA